MRTSRSRIAFVAIVAIVAWGCSGAPSQEEEAKLKARVGAYLEALKGAEFLRAYKEFWKVQARRPEEMEALLALLWQNNGAFVRYAVQDVTPRASDDADVAVSITMLVRDAGSGTEKEETIVKTWRWSVQNGNWYFHGDMKGPAG